MTISPKTTPQQRNAANLYQLFNMADDGGQLYHGLNFAAYEDKVNRFDGGGRTITIGELPEAYVTTHGNMPVVTPAGNRTTLSDAYKNYNQTPVNTNDVPGLTDYLIIQEQPDIATAREVELAKHHRTNEKFNKSVDAAAIGLMSIPGLVPAAGTVLPLLAPGTVGGTLLGEAAGGMAMGELLNESSRALTDRDWGENLRYGLEGTADMLGLGYNPESWSPFAQGAYNFLTDMTNPGYYNSRLLKNGIDTAEQGLTTIVENTLPTARNMYLSYNLNKVPNNLFSDIRTSIYPDIYHRSIYIPRNVPQTRWLAEDMSIPESSEIAREMARRIAGDKNATFGIRRDYDLMYRPNEYNAALFEGRYPLEDGTIPETYKQALQSEAEDAIQRMANIGIREHDIILDDVAKEMMNDAKQTRINLVARKNSSPRFDNPNTMASTTPNTYNYWYGWINEHNSPAAPATINLPLFDQRMRYSNILEPVRDVRIPVWDDVTERVVKGIDGQWRINDPFFGRVTTEDNTFLWPSNIWEDMQHEA